MKKKLIFVNKRFIVGTIVLALLSFAFVERPTDEKSFYDSDFDGLWAGFMPTNADFAFGNLPAVLNLNTGESSGIGTALLMDAEENSPETFNAFTLEGFKIKNTKIIFSLDLHEGGDDEPEAVTFKLKYNSAQGTLSGKFKSKDAAIGSGKVTFYRVYSDNPVTGMWVGNNGGSPAAILVSGKDSVEGAGLVEETFGDLVNGAFGSNRLTGMIDDGNFPYDLDLTLNSKKRLLSGTFTDPDDVQMKAKLQPAGTNGKKIKVKNISPDSIDISSVPPPANIMAEIVISGKNFAEGTMVHLDNTAFSVESVEVRSAKEIRALIAIPDNIADGTKVGVLVVGPDNLQVEKSNVITIKSGGDDDDGGGGGGGGETVSFANDIQPIFDVNCIDCHGGNGGLFLDADSSYSNLVNRRANGNSNFFRVVPGDPDNSYLVMKLRGDSRAGSRMPLGGALPQAQIDLVVKWVEEGAKDN